MAENAQLTQHAIEVLSLGSGIATMSQHAIEVLSTSNGIATMSQHAIEVLSEVIPMAPSTNNTHFFFF